MGSVGTFKCNECHVPLHSYLTHCKKAYCDIDEGKYFCSIHIPSRADNMDNMDNTDNTDNKDSKDSKDNKDNTDNNDDEKKMNINDNDVAMDKKIDNKDTDDLGNDLIIPSSSESRTAGAQCLCIFCNCECNYFSLEWRSASDSVSSQKI